MKRVLSEISEGTLVVLGASGLFAALALLHAAHTTVHAGHVLSLTRHGTLGQARGGAWHIIHSLDAADVVVRLILVEVARQLHDVTAQLGYRDLALAAADEDLSLIHI